MSTNQRSYSGVLILVLAFGVSTALAQAQRPSGPVQQRLAPGLATLTDEVLFGDVWTRPDLPRAGEGGGPLSDDKRTVSEVATS